MGNIIKYMPRFSTTQLIVFTFLALIACGTFLLMLPIASSKGESLSFINALFTATSASCVTGLVVVDTGTYFSTFGQLVIIALIQLGGLGIMTFAMLFSVVIGKKINLQDRLRIQESLNQDEIDGVVRLCLRVVKYTFAIEGVMGTFLAIYFFSLYGPKGIYMGYWHAISAFCNAGFDIMGEFRSFTMLKGDWVVNILITTSIILGSLGFAVMEDIVHKESFSKFRLHTKIVLWTTAILILGGTLALWILEAGNTETIASLPTSEKFLTCYFQSVSPRTAGMNTLPLDKMRDSSLFLTIVLMFIGGSPASTAGGVKTTTIAIIVLGIWVFLRGKNGVTLYSRRVGTDTVYKAFVIVTMGVLWITLATFFLAYFENDRFLNMLFEVTSAFATVGLTMGETQRVCDASKLVLILTMFIGRVGVLTFAMALMSKKKSSRIKYPEEHITIG